MPIFMVTKNYVGRASEKAPMFFINHATAHRWASLVNKSDLPYTVERLEEIIEERVEGEETK